MKKHNLQQGTKAWHDHRANHFNASDAPAMLGVSKYKTRTQLLQEMATGIGQEFDAATERRFADGHRFEALARPLAEEIIGDDLYPVTATEGKLSASFDGVTADETICFEHKTLNEALCNAMYDKNDASALPEEYRAQMEQQMMISGAGKCIFMASKWDNNDEHVESLFVWYESDQSMRNRIVRGWTQFAIDLENYQHVEEVAAPVADAIMGLPAVSVQATGMVTSSNLPQFVSAANKFIADIKTDLITDEDFVNAEANVKFCKSAEDDLEGAKKSMLAQTSSINEVIQTIDFIKGQLASKRLMLDKLVKSEKESRKLAIIDKARIAFNEHFVALEAEIKPVRLIAQHPDFGGAMKGLKKLSAMQDAVDTELANGKISANAAAKDIRAKQAWLIDNGKSMPLLFQDLQQIIYKPLDDFKLIVTSRIAQFKTDEAAKMETLRVKMQAEEEAKANAKVQAAAELQAESKPVATLLEQTTRPAVKWPFPVIPSRIQMIEAIAKSFNITYSAAEKCLREEFAEVAA